MEYMAFEVFIVLLLAANGYLWLLNRRVDALPTNVQHDEKFLKDEEIPVEA